MMGDCLLRALRALGRHNMAVTAMVCRMRIRTGAILIPGGFTSVQVCVDWMGILTKLLLIFLCGGRCAPGSGGLWHALSIKN